MSTVVQSSALRRIFHPTLKLKKFGSSTGVSRSRTGCSSLKSGSRKNDSPWSLSVQGEHYPLITRVIREQQCETGESSVSQLAHGWRFGLATSVSIDMYRAFGLGVAVRIVIIRLPPLRLFYYPRSLAHFVLRRALHIFRVVAH